MEYLDGETLQQRIARGPLPLEEAMRFAIEVAAALDKAHCEGHGASRFQASEVGEARPQVLQVIVGWRT